jgi:aminoglycoside phosphotransferase (APT) family kinase protein
MFLDTGFDAQYQVMGVLGGKGLVKVARLFGLEQDPGLMGRPFYVMEQLQGRVPVSMPVYNKEGWLFDASPEARRTVWESGLREMARLHTVSPVEVPFLASNEPGVSGFQAAIEAARTHLDWARQDVELPFGEKLYAWLIENQPKNPPPGISWGDARMGNMMFGADNRIVGVMDWEQVSLGGPLLDLGWWLYFDDLHSTAQGLTRLPGLGDRQETIDIWQEATGLSAENIGWYEAFAQFRLTALGARMFFLRAGRDGVAASDEHNRQSFERLMKRIG